MILLGNLTQVPKSLTGQYDLSEFTFFKLALACGAWLTSIGWNLGKCRFFQNSKTHLFQNIIYYLLLFLIFCNFFLIFIGFRIKKNKTNRILMGVFVICLCLLGHRPDLYQNQSTIFEPIHSNCLWNNYQVYQILWVAPFFAS